MKKILFALLILIIISFSTPFSVYAVLPNQIIIDPGNPLYMVYNRDADGNGKPDPFYGAGPGDPENFLYRSDWQTILNSTKNGGANTMYVIAVNKFSNAGDCKIGGDIPYCNPFVSDSNPTVDANKLNQIYTRVKALNDAGIVTWFFFYDDSICVFAPCTNAAVPAAESAFINAVVNKLESIPRLIWVVAEEYREAFGPGSQRVLNIAAAIKNADDHDHIIGIHHTTGDNNFDFPGTNAVTQFSHQPSPGNAGQLHTDVLAAINDIKGTGRHVAMVEAHPYHENLVKAQNWAEIRKSNWGVALAGVPTLVLCTWRNDRGCPAPSASALSDWGKIAGFMESTNFNEMSSQDSLKTGSTKYVLAKTGDSYIAYTDTYTGNMGVSGLTNGTYSLKWLDTVSGTVSNQTVSVTASSTSWSKPAGFGNEIALYIKKSSGSGPSVTPSPTNGGPTLTSPPGGKPGDANNDNKVDGLDYVIWLNHYNQNISGASNGDFNNNGKVDGLDYVIWLNNYLA